MGNKKATYLLNGKVDGRSQGRPIHKKCVVNGIKSQHNSMLTRHKKRKLRKGKKMKKKQQQHPHTTVIGDWQMYGTNIRFRRITYQDPLGDRFAKYEGQTYGRPFFFGLFRKRKWETQYNEPDLELCIKWCRKVIEGYDLPLPPKDEPFQLFNRPKPDNP